MLDCYHGHMNYETPFLDEAVAVLSLLAHPVRVKIVLALQDCDMTLNHLADIVDLTTHATVVQLSALVSAGIVVQQHHNERAFYLLANSHGEALAINAVFHAQDQRRLESHRLAFTKFQTKETL